MHRGPWFLAVGLGVAVGVGCLLAAEDAPVDEGIPKGARDRTPIPRGTPLAASKADPTQARCVPDRNSRAGSEEMGGGIAVVSPG
jgi:hypothetical protein